MLSQKSIDDFVDACVRFRDEASSTLRRLDNEIKAHDELLRLLPMCIRLPIDADGETVNVEYDTHLWTDGGDEVVADHFELRKGVELMMWFAVTENGQMFEVRHLHATKPVYDRNGVRIRVGDVLYDANGKALTVASIDPDCDPDLEYGDESTVYCGEHEGCTPINRLARDLTHKRPDSWERIAADAGGEIAERICRLAEIGGAE